MRAFHGVAAGTVALVVLGACGGGGDANGPGGGAGLTARINGAQWQADPIGTVASAVAGVPGGILVTGSQFEGGVTQSVTITLYNISGPGTYALGVSSDVFGGIGQVGEGTSAGGGNGWITDNTGDAGAVTITTLGGGRIAGSFEFVADTGHRNTVGGVRTVTDGHFDLPLTGTLVPVPVNKGSKVSAQYGARYYNAWNVFGLLQDNTGGAGFQFSSTTKTDGLSIVLGGVTAPGTYSLSNSNPVRLVIAGHNGGDAAHCCWGSNAGDVGSVTITSLTASRVTGTISATLQPVAGKPATTPLVISDAAFDVGIQ